MIYCQLNDLIKRLKSTKIIKNIYSCNSFKVKKWLKNGYYENEGLFLAWDLKGIFYSYQIYHPLG